MTRYFLAGQSLLPQCQWLDEGNESLWVVPDDWGWGFEARDLRGIMDATTKLGASFLAVWHLEDSGRGSRIAGHLGAFGSHPGLVSRAEREDPVPDREGAYVGVGEVSETGLAALARLLSHETSARRTVLGLGRAPATVRSFSSIAMLLDEMAIGRINKRRASVDLVRDWLDACARQNLTAIFVGQVHDYNVRALVAIGHHNDLRHLVPAGRSMEPGESISNVLALAQIPMLD